MEMNDIPASSSFQEVIHILSEDGGIVEAFPFGDSPVGLVGNCRCELCSAVVVEFVNQLEIFALECSPKVDPSVMRVCGAEAPLTSNETKKT